MNRHDSVRILHRLHVGIGDTLGAAVEEWSDGVRIVTANAGNGRNPLSECRDRDLGSRGEIHRAVLLVEEQKIEAGGPRDQSDFDASKLADAQAQNDVAGIEFLLGMVDRDRHCL